MRRLSSKEWICEGENLFGINRVNWKFRCPKCNGVQTAQDLLEFKHLIPPAFAIMYCKGYFKPIDPNPLLVQPCRFNAEEFQHGELVAVDNGEGKIVPVFPFAT